MKDDLGKINLHDAIIRKAIETGRIPEFDVLGNFVGWRVDEYAREPPAGSLKSGAMIIREMDLSGLVGSVPAPPEMSEEERGEAFSKAMITYIDEQIDYLPEMAEKIQRSTWDVLREWEEAKASGLYGCVFQPPKEPSQPLRDNAPTGSLPHRCPVCGSPAYIGATVVECSRPGCNGRDRE